ncbi:hypothetical protein [Spirosoma aerophilum]
MLLTEKENAKKVTRTVGFIIIAFALTVITPDAMAQGGVTGSVKNIAKIIQTSANVLFIILMVVGLIRTVAGFISNSPNASKNLLMLVVGAILWFGFNTIVEDITSSVGSSSTGGYEGR